MNVFQSFPHPFPPKPYVDATLLQFYPSSFTVKNRKESEVYFYYTDSRAYQCNNQTKHKENNGLPNSDIVEFQLGWKKNVVQ
jgi:hypothetical protein